MKLTLAEIQKFDKAMKLVGVETEYRQQTLSTLVIRDKTLADVPWLQVTKQPREALEAILKEITSQKD